MTTLSPRDPRTDPQPGDRLCYPSGGPAWTVMARNGDDVRVRMEVLT